MARQRPCPDPAALHVSDMIPTPDLPQVHAFADFLASGAGKAVEAVPPRPDDVCCIMYTRWGATGRRHECCTDCCCRSSTAPCSN